MEQVKLKHKDHFHGSDLEKIEDIYGIKKEDIVSYSANINPLGISDTGCILVRYLYGSYLCRGEPCSRTQRIIPFGNER